MDIRYSCSLVSIMSVTNLLELIDAFHSFQSRLVNQISNLMPCIPDLCVTRNELT